MNIEKGKPVTITVGFKHKGVAVNVIQPPTWQVLNDVDRVLLQGAAVPSGSKWSATFTIPVNYVVPNGEETLTIKFSVITDSGKSYVHTKELTLQDLDDTFTPIGIIYSLMTDEDLIDSFYAKSPDVEYIKYSVYTPNNTLLFQQNIDTPTHSRKTSKGYEYLINLGRPPADVMLQYSDPMIGTLEYKLASDPLPASEVHPIYPINARVAVSCNALKQYLDKAQLVEIDPSLQWYLPELVHALFEGIKHINSIGINLITYWTLQNYPTQMQQYLITAAALYALNARYIAEGFNSFNFNGLNTTLEYDRRDTIVTKIEELRAFLDTYLSQAKTTVVSSGYNIGTPPSDSPYGQGKIPMGLLGLQGSATNNRLSRIRNLRRFY